MSDLVADCPRCGAQQITFDLLSEQHVRTEWGWQLWFETFCICRKCKKSTVFLLSQREVDDKAAILAGIRKMTDAVNRHMTVEGFINLKDTNAEAPPPHVPDAIAAAFREGAMCTVVECWNAAATMFRLCVDLATRSKLPAEEVAGLNAKIRRDLGLRLPWLFDNRYLPEDLRELSSCVKEDGNDGAHAGTLTKGDALDLKDFAYALLERMYSEPKRLAEAKERREKRRSAPAE